MNPPINDLQNFARNYLLSIEELRHCAFTSCGIPQDAPQHLVDLWLYERLAMQAHAQGSNFFAHSDQSLRNTIAFSLSWPGLSGSFEERCAASWAELVANPINRREIALPKPFSCYLEPEYVGAEHELFCDNIVVLTALIERANQAPTDPA